MLSRIGLRQLVVLLVLGSLLVIAGSMFWAGSMFHQQALMEHDLQRQHNYAQQLAGRLGQRLHQEDLSDILDGLLIDQQQNMLVVDETGVVLYPEAAVLTSEQKAALNDPLAKSGALVAGGRGNQYSMSVVAVPGTGWQLILQAPLQEVSEVDTAFVSVLAYSLPAGLLLLLLAWLAGGHLARPFRLMAAQTRNLREKESVAAIQTVQASSKEANELQRGLLQGARQLAGFDPDGQLDSLTGLSTPDVLPDLLVNISQGGMSFAAIVLAVDDYEQLQEHFPQALRDQALQQLGQLLLQYSRELDISVRMAEEVYLLLLPQCPLTIAQRIAERLRARVQEAAFAGVGHMTISAGVTTSLQAGAGDPLETLKQARQLLSSARREGQNRVHVMAG